MTYMHSSSDEAAACLISDVGRERHRRREGLRGTRSPVLSQLLEKITEHKIKLVDERHKIKHKETEKPRMAMEIRKLWREADEASKRGGNNAAGGAKQRMNLEELTKHLKTSQSKAYKNGLRD